jgi:hypothetical protein
MIDLPVREMVLYKHGVGFFIREGKTDASQVALTFRQDEINDVLKSLAVFDKSGAQVLGIHYQTPMDKADRLANTSIRLSEFGSLRDLLGDLRGRKASLDFETTPGTIESITGRVLGIDKTNNAKKEEMSSLVAIQNESGQVKVLDFYTLRSISIEDTQSEQDLTYFLDTNMSEDTRRTVNVRLSEGEHELVVYYVAPSPTWRVSYRIVAESDENDETGTALLQGWGLFDNRLEEDLDNVRVTLVAGQPISFIYDLYESKIPMRPIVKDQSRVAPGPVEFSGEVPDWLSDAAPLDSMDMNATFSAGSAHESARSGVLRKSSPKMERAAMAQSTAAPAETKDKGEFFQYIVNTPVSVKRGESALVPIIGSEVKYERELLYNGAKLPKHPVASLRFENTSGLTLERGPVTVVEDGDYKGEAVIAFTKDKNQVYLPYAVELGVTIKEFPRNYTETHSLNIQGSRLVIEEHSIKKVTYIVENTTQNALTVTIEARKNPLAELFDTADPDVETSDERRWKVNIPAQSKIEFFSKERSLNHRYQELRRLDNRKFHQYLENKWLDDETLNELSEMLDTLAAIQIAKTEIEGLDIETTEIYNKQEQLRANMKALNATGDEAAFRKRIVGQLETSQDRLDEIDVEDASLKQQITDAEEKVNQIIADLGKQAEDEK